MAILGASSPSSSSNEIVYKTTPFKNKLYKKTRPKSDFSANCLRYLHAILFLIFSGLLITNIAIDLKNNNMQVSTFTIGAIIFSSCLLLLVLKIIFSDFLIRQDQDEDKCKHDMLAVRRDSVIDPCQNRLAQGDPIDELIAWNFQNIEKKRRESVASLVESKQLESKKVKWNNIPVKHKHHSYETSVSCIPTKQIEFVSPNNKFLIQGVPLPKIPNNSSQPIILPSTQQSNNLSTVIEMRESNVEDLMESPVSPGPISLSPISYIDRTVELPFYNGSDEDFRIRPWTGNYSD